MNNCFICGHSALSEGSANRMFEDTGKMIIIKDIPALVCNNCGEVYFTTETMRKLERSIETTVGELEIVAFPKIA